VYEDSSCLHGEEGGGGLRHVHVHAHAHCDVWAGAAYADLLYSLLYIPLYIKLLYKAEHDFGKFRLYDS
jgi:hypothetical protein